MDRLKPLAEGDRGKPETPPTKPKPTEPPPSNFVPPKTGDHKARWDAIRQTSHELPDPGGDIVCALLDELEALHAAKSDEALMTALQDAHDDLDFEPDYHHQAMGCGLEDRDITDRYEAMRHGWNGGVERMRERVDGVREDITKALKGASDE